MRFELVGVPVTSMAAPGGIARAERGRARPRLSRAARSAGRDPRPPRRMRARAGRRTRGRLATLTLALRRGIGFGGRPGAGPDLRCAARAARSAGSAAGSGGGGDARSAGSPRDRRGKGIVTRRNGGDVRRRRRGQSGWGIRGRMLGGAGEAHHESQQRVVAAVRIMRPVRGEQVVETVRWPLYRDRRNREPGIDEPTTSHRHEQRCVTLHSRAQIFDARIEESAPGQIVMPSHAPKLRRVAVRNVSPRKRYQAACCRSACSRAVTAGRATRVRSREL